MQNLKQTVLLLHTELKCFGGRKHWKTVVGIVLIMIMISTFSYVTKQQAEAAEGTAKEPYITLGIANEDTSEYAGLLISYFKENSDFTEYVSVAEGEKNELKNQFEEGSLDCLLVIPEGFAEQMIRMEHLPIEVLISTENATKALLLQTALAGYESYIRAVEVNCAALYDKMKEDGFSYEELEKANLDISMELIFTALGKDDFFTKREMERERGASVMTGYLYAAFWFGMLFLYFPVGNQLRSFFEKGLAQRMFVAQVPKGSLLAAVLLPYVLLTLAMAAVPALLAGENRAERFVITVCLLLPVLLFTALLGILCKNGRGYLFVYSMVLTGMALLGGSLIPPLYLPDEFLAVTKWLPNYRFAELLGKNAVETELAAVGISSGVVFVMFVILLLFGMKRRGEERRNA